jgi:hypothetical protein
MYNFLILGLIRFRCFLKYDTREFLNVLSLSFEEPIFQTELGRRQKQRIVDILLQVMVEQGNFTVRQCITVRPQDLTS